MNNKKRGISTIVTTLIIILISLAAIGIVGLVINNFVKNSTQGIDINSKCLNVNVEATKVECTDGTTTQICDVDLKRTGTDNSAIAGVKFVFRGDNVNSNLISIEGNIDALVGKMENGVETGVLNTEELNKLEVTVSFKDASGKEQLCPQTTSFNF